MKNKFLYLGVLSLLLIGGCTNLDVDVKSNYTAYPDNEIAQEALATDCYFAHRSRYIGFYSGYVALMEMTGGAAVAVSFSGDYYDEGPRMRATLHKTLPQDYSVDWYSDIQGGITKCNKALMSLDSGNGEISKTAAQIRAIRAYYHWMLMDAFGDTPILDHLYEDSETVERTARKDVTEWIVSELDTVKDMLPTELNNANYGKPTRWMAQALLAKIYLNWNVYTGGDITAYDPATANVKLADCIAACDDIIKSGLFDLSDDYKTKFNPNNGPQIKDFIYAIPYTAADKDGNDYGRYHTWRRGQNDGDGGPGLYNAALTNSCAGCFMMNPDFSDLFNLPGDRRNDCIYGNDPDGVVYQYGADYEKTDIPTYYKGELVKMKKTITLAEITDPNGNKIPMGPEYDHLDVGANMTGWTQGWISNKYCLNASDYNTYGRSNSNDVPVFRYADILLMKAEAILRGGSATNGDDPMSLFNQIRSYVNAPLLSSGPSLQDILDERGREFFDEGWRRNDMIRFGQFENDTWLIHTINPDAGNRNWRIFPIPVSVMNSNTNWKQNPGY